MNAGLDACTKCPLHERRLNRAVTPVRYTGAPDARILFVGDNPSDDENDIGGLPFSTPEEKFVLLREVFSEVGIDTSQVAYTYGTRCAATHDYKIAKKEVLACRPWLIEELEDHPSVCIVVSFGKTATSAVLAQFLKAGSVRSQVIDVEVSPIRKVKLISTAHLFQAILSPSERDALVFDLTLAKNYATPGYAPFSMEHHKTTHLGSYRLVTDVQGLKSMVTDLFDRTIVAFDTETRRLDPWHLPTLDARFLTSIQFCGAEDTAYFVPITHSEITLPSNWLDGMAEILGGFFRSYPREGHALVGFNAKFDQVAIAHSLGIFPTIQFDGMVFDHLRRGLPARSLKKIAWEVSPYGGYEDTKRQADKAMKDDEGDSFLCPLDTLFWYGCLDAEVTYRLAVAACDILAKDTRLTFLSGFLARASNALTSVEIDGWKIDLKYLEEYGALLQTKLVEVRQKTRTLLEGPLEIFKARAKVDFMLTSPAHLRVMLYEILGLTPTRQTPKGAASTARLALNDLKGTHPVIDLILESRALEKLYTGFYERWKEGVALDSRLHFHYNMTSYFDDDAGDWGGAICLAAGELVLTNRGYLAVEQVRSGDQVITHTGKSAEVEVLVDNSIKPIYEVRSVGGLCLQTTGNHPYLTPQGWVEARELRPGTVVKVHSNPERWKKVTDFEDFSVSSWGRIRNDKVYRLVSLRSKGRWGHLKVTLRRNGSQVRGVDLRDFTVHRLVAQAFVPNQENQPEVRHLNGFSWDNTVGNLRWGTDFDNKKDAVAHGSMLKRRMGVTKLTEQQVLYARENPHINNRKIALELGVCWEHVRDIRSGKRWPVRSDAEKRVIFLNDVVKSISLLPAAQTYGLVVAHEHSHVTGGFVTHNTGRLSSSGAAGNCQQIPKNKELRRVFLPDDSESLMFDVDFKTLEYVVTTMHSQDPKLVAAFCAGYDVHSAVGAELFGKTIEEMTRPENKLLRHKAKTLNFAILYGAGPRKVAETAGMTEDEASAFISQYLQQYPGLSQWIEKTRRRARRYGFSESKFGRRRLLPDARLPSIFSNQGRLQAALRRAVNSPIQSDASDLCLWGLIRLKEWLDFSGKRARIKATVHDSLVLSVPLVEVEEVALKVKDILEHPGLPFFEASGVPLRVSGALGETWGGVEDFAW